MVEGVALGVGAAVDEAGRSAGGEGSGELVVGDVDGGQGVVVPGDEAGEDAGAALGAGEGSGGVLVPQPTRAPSAMRVASRREHARLMPPSSVGGRRPEQGRSSRPGPMRARRRLC
ncbi:hypothetical protein OEB99_11680 [Actinotalea sp. M2MS4P-6]|nr:hypothetical protein [Actinotalea sp. M2MS4P-6]